VGHSAAGLDLDDDRAHATSFEDGGKKSMRGRDRIDNQ
jgi:hypothetical protein